MNELKPLAPNSTTPFSLPLTGSLGLYSNTGRFAGAVALLPDWLGVALPLSAGVDLMSSDAELVGADVSVSVGFLNLSLSFLYY